MALTKISGHFLETGSITQAHLHANHGITSASIAEGSKLFYTAARARAAISATGSLSYNSSTGVMSFTMPSLVTTNVTEGTNLYYTDARADARITAASTSDLSEGTNLYYTNARADARADARITAASTSDLSEGTNLYYTNTRTDARVNLQTGANLSLSNKSTSNLSEGTNLYYTNARADARVALIVDSAPGTLNTLNELAAALGDDASFSTTVTNSIAAKLPLTGGALTGALQVNGFIDITDVTATALRWYDGTTFKGGLGLNDWALSGSSNDIAMYIAGDNSFFIQTNNIQRVEINSTSASFAVPLILNGTGANNATFDTNATRLDIKNSNATTHSGLALLSSNGTWQLELHGSGSNYGFLGSSWGSWNLRKAVSGGIYLNNNTTYFVQPEGTSTMNAATFAGTLTWSGGGSANANTAYGWGNHGLSAQDKTDITNLSGTNTGDQDLSTYLTSFDITTQTDTKYLRSNADDTASGIITLTKNSASGLANSTFSIAKTVIGGLHFANGGGPGGNNGNEAAITFQGSSASEAQAGIYVHNNGSEGTHMMFATTDSYATGPQAGITIYNTGNVTIRGTITASGYNKSNWDTAYTHSQAAHAPSNANYISSTPTFTDVYATSWFRNNAANTGLYNQATVNHWYSENNSTWTVGSTSSSSGRIQLRYNHQGAIKGSFYWDASGVGLLNDQSGWGVRLNQGTGYGGKLFGAWETGGVHTATGGNSTQWNTAYSERNTIDGIGLSGTTNSSANKIMRTDGNGYANFGNINTNIGNYALSSDFAHVYASTDNYIRRYTKSDFKVLLGLPKSTYDRRDSNSNAAYHTGAFSYGQENMNDMFSKGCGFIDTWSSPTGRPPVGTHFNGIQATHYSSSNTYHHGMQMVMSAGDPSHTYLRGWWANGGSGNAWQRIWTDGNDGSGSGLDADLLDGVHGASFFRADADDTASGQYSFTKVNDHAIRVGTIRGTVVGGQSGEYIQMYNRVNIGSPAGWGSRAAPTYGLSVYGGVDLATDTGSVTISGNTAWHAGNSSQFTTTLNTKLAGIAASATNVTNNNQLTNGAGYLTVSGTINDANALYISDTRGAVRAPSYYPRNRVSWDFQNSSDTLAGGDGWHGLMTVSKWSTWDASHQIDQLVFNGPEMKFRESTNDSTWGAWKTLLDSEGGQTVASLTVSGALSAGNISTTGTIRVGTGLYIGDASDNSSDIYMEDSDHGQRRIHCNSNNIGFLNQANGWGSYCTDNGDWWTDFISYAGASMRAPIFYDNNNTGYYTDPASTSHMNTVQIAGTLRFMNYGLGVTGTYTSTRLQTIFNMDDQYSISADGSSAGSAYGLYWSHQNAGGLGGANNLASHGIIILENGGYKGSWGGGRLVTTADVRGTLFYDYNNTGYYLDPASTSNINVMNAAGIINTAGDLRSNTGLVYNRANTAHYIRAGGESRISGDIFFQSSNSVWFNSQTTSSNYLRLTGGTTSGAYFDFNCTGSTKKMHWRQYGTHTRFTWDYSTAAFLAMGPVTANGSDARLKENIVTIDGALTKVKAMRGVYYNRIDLDTERRRIGVIAQEIETILPEVVDRVGRLDYMPECDDDEIRAVSYGNISAVLIEAIKEQQVIIEDLKSRLETLENQ